MLAEDVLMFEKAGREEEKGTIVRVEVDSMRGAVVVVVVVVEAAE